MLTRFWIWCLTKLGFDPRGLFVFFDGRRWRSVDPLEVARALFTHSTFDWDETPQLLRTGQALTQLEAFRVIGIAVREVFQIRPVSAGGLSDHECLELLSAFRSYLGDVKKNGSLFPISPDSSESLPPVDKTTWPMKPDSGSGLTPNAASLAPPGFTAGLTTAN